MPKLNLKLGEGPDGLEIKMPHESRMFNPAFRIESDEKPELPHSGTMTIRFKKIESTVREDSDGDNHYSCTIEVHEVIDAYSDEPEAPARSRNKETENALDELKAKRKPSY